MSLILFSGIVGLFAGRLIDGLANYLPRFASSRPAARTIAGRRFVPATLELLTGVLSKKPIRSPEPLVIEAAIELIIASLFGYLEWRFGLTWNLLLFAFLGSFLVLIAVIDMKYRLVLNVLLIPALIGALLLSLMPGEPRLSSVLAGGGFGLVVFAFAAFVRPGGLGTGDIKLATLIGLIFGFPNVILPLLVGVLAGGFAAVLLLTTRHGNRSTQVPYAPFLCLGALIALLLGPQPPFPISL